MLIRLCLSVPLLSACNKVSFLETIPNSNKKARSIHNLCTNKELLQLKLVNSKSYELEALFRSIDHSNYREIDVKIYNQQK